MTQHILVECTAWAKLQNSNFKKKTQNIQIWHEKIMCIRQKRLQNFSYEVLTAGKENTMFLYITEVALVLL